jgi:hypothetical protein
MKFFKEIIAIKHRLLLFSIIIANKKDCKTVLPDIKRCSITHLPR